ncbi:MAG: esterase-like activity of phytase family protein [Sphingomonas sp.]
MLRKLLLTAALASACVSPAGATVFLLAQGSLTGSAAGAGVDLSGLTGLMENGLPGNILGGVGSGLAYAGGNTFVAVPDRGPNATPYNSALDDTVSYISRFQTLNMSLVANPAGSALAFSLTPTLTQTTLLSSPNPLNYGSGAGLGNQINGTPIGSGAPANNTAGTYYFTGRSDNYGAGNSGNPLNGRFDPESIRLSNDGKSVFISDEYGPYVRQFDSATGKLVKTFTLPDNLNSPNLSPKGDTEISGNTVGRVANKGMEGLAITPDGKTLVGIMQAPLEQDAANPATANMVRIVTIDIATGQTHEYAYQLTTGSGVSDIVAINDHQFLVDERDGKGLGDGSNAKIKQIFQIDISGAKDITGLNGADAAAAAVTKSSSPFVDLVMQLTANGLTKGQIPAKIEGIAFGQDVTLNGETLHTLYVANDNDFLPGTAGANQFFVFAFSDKDLPNYVAQQFGAVPEPASWGMMLGGFGIAGIAIRRRRKAPALA